MADGILGLLGSSIDKVQGLLSNPVVQGIGAAAATGFNPLLGLLAAPGIQSARDRKASENELLRQQVLQNRRRSQATQDLRGLLADDTAVSSPIGLLNVEGGVDMLPAGRRVPTVQTQGGQERLLGLLSQIAPDQVAQSLLSQSTANPPTSIAELDALGLPRTPEGFARLQEIKNTLSPTDQVNLALANAQLVALQRGNQEAAREAAAARQQERFSIKDTLKQGRNILRLTENLEGTFLEPGRVGTGARRPLVSLAGEVAGFFGNEEFAEEQQQLVADFDTFKKDSVNFVLTMTDQFGTDLTNLQLQTLQKANAGQDVSPAAIRSVVTDVLRRTLNEAEAKGIEIPERAEFEALLNGLTKGNVVTRPSGATVEFLD